MVNVLLVEELVRAIGGLRIVSEPPVRPASIAPRPSSRPRPDRPAAARLRRLRSPASPARRPAHARPPLRRALGERDARRRARGIAGGFTDYWTKPIDFAVFIAALRRLFPGARADDAAELAARTEPAPGE